MDKEDARYQKLKQLHERRKQVARLLWKGYGMMVTIGMTGLSYPAVLRAIDLYEAGGYAALKPTPRAAQAWLSVQYPEIEKHTKTEGGEIHWGDETALVDADVRGRSYAPAGKMPVTFTVGCTRGRSCR